MHHVYVHIPFCARRCSYCDFAIAVRKTVPSREFVDLLLRERELRSGDRATGPPLATLYLGGGTPSSLDPGDLTRLVRSFPLDGGAEVTVEANPDDVTREAAAAWVAAGVNRVSLGVQSFHPRVLTWMHRTHTAPQSSEAVGVLRAAGIAAISLDLIFGLPEGLEYDFVVDLASALDLEPDHVSVYGLTVEPRTPLARWMARGAVSPGSDERAAEEFLLAHDTLASAGFEHYEVSNYARPGRRARHNAAYWSGAPYTGFGPAAHGFDGAARRWNLREWTAWRRAVAAGRDPVEGRERLTREQTELERLYLGLRTIEGVPAPRGPGPMVQHSRPERRGGGGRAQGPGPLAGVWESARRAGWLEVRGDRLVATQQGWLRLDSLLPFLTTSPGGG